MILHYFRAVSCQFPTAFPLCPGNPGTPSELDNRLFFDFRPIWQLGPNFGAQKTRTERTDVLPTRQADSETFFEKGVLAHLYVNLHVDLSSRFRR